MVANVQERERTGSQTLSGRTVYIPQMAYAGSRLMAACFRAIGVNAEPAPDSDATTLELGGLHSSGEECLPHKITLGDFLKVTQRPDFVPSQTAFFMPTAHGPCRFGQYGPYLKQVMREKGFDEVMVISPSSVNGYAEIGQHATELLRTAWMGVVAGDIAMKCLLKTRPYETRMGTADAAFTESVADCCEVLAQPGLPPKERLRQLAEAVARMRDRFRSVPARYVKGRPLIGLVGEIFCRLNTFSNDEVARRIERLGGECWISDISEWVWYTNWFSEDHLNRERGFLNLDMLKLKIKSHLQHKYEHALMAPMAGEFQGYEEPHDIREVLNAAEPFLPAEGSIGEMVLSVGKIHYLHGQGADGIVDISPFTCMNGIICEGVYPALSAAHDNLPIRICYFDGVNTNIDRDLEIFLDLARGYQRRKSHARTYPGYFEPGV